MKKLLFLFTAIAFASCNSDDDQASIQNANYWNLFESQTTPQFKGKMNDQSFGWMFGVGTFQMGTYWGPGDTRNLSFSLISETNDDKFIITTPSYDVTSDESFNAVFGLGEKNLGPLSNKWNIRIQKNNVDYITCNASSNKIEIIKTQEILDNENPNLNKLKVWFKIDELNFDSCGQDFKVVNGLIFAEFNGYRN